MKASMLEKYGSTPLDSKTERPVSSLRSLAVFSSPLSFLKNDEDLF
jgi:hypothetical protein